LIFHFWTPAVRNMMRLTIPVALSAGVLQISTLLDKGIAFAFSEAPGRNVFHVFGHALRFPMAEGATQRLNWAQYLYQFPLGIFAVALATAIFPRLSADAHGDHGREQFKSILRRGIEASLFIGLPASVGMVLVRTPAVKLLFQHGNFTPEHARLVAISTAFYSSAIWAFSLQQILNRAYYALHDTVTPLVWGIANLVINTIVELPLLWTSLGESGMAVGTLVSFAIQAVVMLWMIDRRVGGLQMSASGSLRTIGKMLVASAVMCAACLAVQHASIYPIGSGKIIWGLQLMLLMTVGGISYFATCWSFGIDVLAHVRPSRRVSAQET
jgi:putative peptidoglycan lipid II flippase